MDHQQHNNNLQHLQELDDSDQDDAISLCDLPIDPPHNQQESSSTAPRDSFDFSFTFNTPINNTNQTDVASNDKVNNNNSIIGKIRPLNPIDDLHDINGDKINKLQLQSMKSMSCRVPETVSYRLNYSSSSSRKHRVFIGYGLAKIPTKMELSDIKKRQNSRRKPAPMFPSMTSHGGGNVGEPAAAGRKHYWVLIANVLAKIPTKMELSDIKKRQNSRRKPAPMFPAVTAHGGGNVEEPAADGRKHHWALIANVLAKATVFTCVLPPLMS